MFPKDSLRKLKLNNSQNNNNYTNNIKHNVNPYSNI